MGCWLRDDAGVRIPLVDGALFIGRDAACHIVLSDATISRRHALVLSGDGATRVVPLGKRPVEVGGAAIQGPTVVRHGDELRVGASLFRFDLEDASPATRWMIDVEGRRYAIHRAGFAIGGGEDDDLQIEGWPERAIVLSVRRRGARLTTSVPIDEPPLEPGAAQDVARGDVFALRGKRFQLVEATAAQATLDQPSVATEVDVEFFPNGGVATFTVGRAFVVWLPQRRADLIATLVRPPTGYAPGDWIGDDVLIPRVWGSEGASRLQVNTLIHRTRQSLGEAGLNGAELIERAKGGGATRLLLAAGANIQVR